MGLVEWAKRASEALVSRFDPSSISEIPFPDAMMRPSNIDAPLTSDIIKDRGWVDKKVQRTEKKSKCWAISDYRLHKPGH